MTRTLLDIKNLRLHALKIGNHLSTLKFLTLGREEEILSSVCALPIFLGRANTQRGSIKEIFRLLNTPDY